MILEPIVQWIAFLILSFISIGGALGMATTMSMFRSGIFLMASFIGVAGLFILLSADLMALLQVMMYIGGMLIMILYMLLFSNDPGGAMMADMDMSFFENFFSRGLKPDPDHKDVGEEDMEMDMGGMSHAEMSMTTAIKSIAAVVALIVGILLMGLLLLRPVWILSGLDPATDSGRQVGNLLMSKYMMGFEGAGLLILIGIFGAVLVSRPGKFPDSTSRDAYVAVDKDPPPITEDRPKPLTPPDQPYGSEAILDVHHEKEKGPWPSR